MLTYMPIIGSVLLTIVIAWIIVSSIIAHRRKIGAALAGRTYCVIPNGNEIMPEARKSICCGAATFRPRWTEDGWVAPCQCCGAWQYLGDDYDHPPEDALTGIVQSFIRPEVTSDDEGEPLPASLSHTPNVGGEGQPDYAGPHYLVEHDRFVPYDVLRDPIPGAAVHIVGNVACAGPLDDELPQGQEDADDLRSD